MRKIELDKHLANAEEFVLKWTTGKNAMTDEQVIKLAKQIELEIRKRWHNAYNSKIAKSLSQITMEHNGLDQRNRTMDYS